MSGAPDFVIRAAGRADLAGFLTLRELAGPGFTSFTVSDAVLEERLAKSAKSFAAAISRPGDERYMLALEHLESGEVAGSAGVKATVGASPPFFNFRVLRVAQASAAAQRRFDLDVLILVNEFTGCTEVGSLFVRPEHRASGIGRMLAQSRYMLMAAAPQRFNERVVSELRGVVSADGRSPFWDHLGRHFFKMTFEEADRMSAATDNQFILDLMPKYPIYVDLLPDEARAVIGECHPDGRGARRLLEWEGFRSDNVVDIFDGGPLLTVARDAIRTVRETRRLALVARETLATPRRALVATTEVAGFRCAPCLAETGDGGVHAHPEVIEAIGLRDGDEALVWIEHAP
jgi:arginine N-succinyltransferase